MPPPLSAHHHLLSVGISKIEKQDNEKAPQDHLVLSAKIERQSIVVANADVLGHYLAFFKAAMAKVDVQNKKTEAIVQLQNIQE